MIPLAGFIEHFRGTFPDLEGSTILVALSGGPDSVALLNLLAEPDLGLELNAAYVHHHTRAGETDQEIALCANHCERLGVAFHRLEIDEVERPPEGREAAWRTRRYDVLEGCRHRIDAAAIATGHHRDDVAEGVLMQLLRGAGPRAMAGIEARSAGHVIRPLLPFTRRQLREWLEHHRLSWSEDSSNLSPEHLRNRVRSQILPMLEEEVPAVRSHLVALAAALAESESFWDQTLVEHALWIDPWSPDGGVPVDSLAALPCALQARWLHAQAERCGLGKVTRGQTRDLQVLVAGAGEGTVNLANRWRLRLARRQLWLEPPQEPAPFTATLIQDRECSLPMPGWRVIWRHRSAPCDSPLSMVWHPPADSPPWVRSVEPGDLVEIDGKHLRASRLMAARLPRHLRATWPALGVGATLCWIPGVWQRAGNGGSDVVEVFRL